MLGMTNRLIVLSGEAGAGKDSVAKVLVEKHGWTLYSLAGPLKRFAEDMFGFTKEQLYGPSSARNAIDKRWALKCLTCTGTGKVYGTDNMHAMCEGSGVVYPISPRTVLQPLGSEYLRDMLHPDILTMRARPDLEILLRSGNVVINDARYDNDRNNLHEWLGAIRVDVIGVVGKRTDGARWRQHQSELSRPEVDKIEFSILNDEEWPFPGLPDKVEAMLEVLCP
jgi:hypothetical protein